jgi:hypothetical protein
MKYRVKRHAVQQPLDQSYRLIPLTQGQNAIVDTKDFDWLNQWNWCARWDKDTKSFYAMRKIRKGDRWPDVMMARVILGCKPRKDSDHINHDTLDNRRNNLRSATRSQNKANSDKYKGNKSGFKGVHRGGRKWIACIMHNGKRRVLGRFYSAKEAARAYDQGAKRAFGEFAFLNFPNHED